MEILSLHYLLSKKKDVAAKNTYIIANTTYRWDVDVYMSLFYKCLFFTAGSLFAT